MRSILIISGLLAVAIIAWAVFAFKAQSHFGAEFTGAPEAEVADLLTRPTEYLGKRVTLHGKVEDQCPTTGCFFYLSAGQGRLKIELGDLAQSIPERMGAAVTVEGQLMALGDGYQFIGTAAEFH